MRDGLWRSADVLKGCSIGFHGEPEARVIIVESGLVKLSYLSVKGNERIKSLIADVGVFGGFEHGEDLSYEAVCLEPSRVVGLPMPWVRESFANNAGLQKAVSEFWSWLSTKKRDRENALLCMTPVQRYRALQIREPSLVSRISQGDIARYIGVTPIAFSRIKRRLRETRSAGTDGDITGRL